MKYIWFSICAAIILILSACSNADDVRLPPDEVITSTAEKMQKMTGFSLSLARSGAFAFLDESETISFQQLQGQFSAPESVQGTVKVIAPGIIAEVEVVSIGSTQWQTDVFTGEWEQLQDDWGFNPSTLFDQEIGLQSILTSDISDLSFSDETEIDVFPGKTLIAINGVLNGINISKLTHGLISADSMDISLWIEPATYELHRLVIVEYQGDPDLERTWQFDFWDFDEQFTIEPPI